MFQSFHKIPRLNREIVVTEKIDGTNAQIHIIPGETEIPESPVAINEEFMMFAGSRNRYITPEKDNFGFAKFVQDNAEELFKLGPGRHYGEWWGKGIQRGYELDHKRFSLFNVNKWTDGGVRPSCCHVVPILAMGTFDSLAIEDVIGLMRSYGSTAAPGFMDPEGIMVYHTAANQYFKVTCKDDNKPKMWREKNGAGMPSGVCND